MTGTPYDTGERLEPNPWTPTRRDPDTYGRVDFENDESATELTLVIKADGNGGWVIEVDNHGGQPISMVVSE